jgi:hypothetical protein
MDAFPLLASALNKTGKHILETLDKLREGIHLTPQAAGSFLLFSLGRLVAATDFQDFQPQSRSGKFINSDKAF